MKKKVNDKRKQNVFHIGMILLVIAILTTVSFLHMFKKVKNVQAAAVTHGVAVNNEIPPENGVKGTETNPFVILEIVPYDGYAEIGYLIDGCEPVDISKAILDGFSINTIGSFQGGVVSGSGSYTYKNKNLFLKDVLHLSDAQIPGYHIVVKTMQPNELNQHPEWISRSDLIYINPKTHMQLLVGIWGKYNKLGKLPVTNYATNFYYNDISWETAIAIFKKVIVAKDYAGIIIDATTYDSAGPSAFYKKVTSYQFGKDLNGNQTSFSSDTMQGNINNMYKLCLMLRTMNPIIFYNLYLNDNRGAITPLISETTVNGITTGCYNRQPGNDAKIYWTAQTFLPTKIDGTRASYDDWINMWENYQCNPIMFGNVSVMNHIYTYNGDNSLTIEFVTGKIYNDGKFTKELFDYIKENGYPFTPATAVNYILHNKNEGKASIRILDLEPCNEFTLSIQDIREFLLTYNGEINIVHQTSSEFNGKIEDLNSSYDMIFMGLNSGAFQVSNGHTVYNDASLNGKIYLHVGDLITSNISDTDITSANWNIAGANTNKLRLPGNDITKLKLDTLNHFINAGYPIITSNRFFNGSSVNNYLIDSNSNIAAFIAAQSAKSNFFTSSSAKSNIQTLSDCISLIKPEINLISKPVPYNISASASPSELTNPAYYINGSDSTNRDLSFQFQILDGTQGKEYTAKLYIDENADGKFSAEEEQCKDTFLSGNQTNTLTKILEKSYYGIIPWKLTVYKAVSPDIRTEVTGYSAVLKKNEDKQTLRILQINQNDYPANNSKTSRLNLQKDTIFQNYIANLNDYKVDFTTITIKDFENLYNNKRNEISNLKILDNNITTYDRSNPSTDRLANYDMVILGFSDDYDDISNDMALNNLADYIQSGRCVLCTHDNTSFNNKPGSAGYNFNLKFRDILGMDRFGIRTGGALVKDDAAKDYYSYSEKYLQGFTYYAAMRLLNNNTAYKAYNGIGSALMSKQYNTTQVNKLNEGQLTSYPYKIIDSIPCGETYAQYYQLNLENPDIVVWYTLGGSTVDSDHMYSVSPNDASNNYYIYNKGNITYSGMGHSAVTSSGAVKEDEIKLFVNTIVAAYKASLTKPAITVKDMITANENEYIKYLNLDPNETTFDSGDVQKIEFCVKDNNIMSSHYPSNDLGASITLEDGTPLKIYSVSDNLEVPDRIAKVTDPAISLTKLNSNKSYYIIYPMTSFGSSDARKLMIYTENCKGLNTSASVQFVRRTLFDLD